METNTTSTRMSSLVVLYDMHTGFFPKAIVDITDTDAHNRLNTKANHAAWLTGSLVEQRYALANMLGVDASQSAHQLFENNKGIDDQVTYPPLSEFKADWDKIAPILKDELLKITDEKLDSTFEMMPGFRMTMYEFITFVIYREASCIGQLALWRRLLGYDALKYD
ncbi:DinB family protein [Pedobacter metabolipauper]|uniref:DinB family protein n=1 Tax=Pedobacter metabolipauper TaxID=425513 RepID=A0A4R6SVS5_9SPHI|nr:DinB family protein [Pedobacter metabolipauper]TDQ08212.1 hypothetical protein ATK78_2719 [Pedobacter metabolipauper]